LVLNKRDLLAHKRSEETRALRPGTPVVLVSAQTGEGLDDLRDAVRQLVLTGGDRPSEDAVVFNARHQSCIRDAGGQVDACLQAADRELSEEYLLYHLRRGLDHLAEITGETTPELVLERIFASFCIGK
jgi:tRNA modification GTPase